MARRLWPSDRRLAGHLVPVEHPVGPADGLAGTRPLCPLSPLKRRKRKASPRDSWACLYSGGGVWESNPPSTG